MGFFQDLKEDLSLAVNELIPETEEEALDGALEQAMATDGEVSEDAITEIATEAVAEDVKTEDTASLAKDVEALLTPSTDDEFNEALFREAVNKLDENETYVQPVETVETVDAVADIPAEVSEAPAQDALIQEVLGVLEEEAVVTPVQEVAVTEAAPEVVAEAPVLEQAPSEASIDMAKTETASQEEDVSLKQIETELEKEVDKIMTGQAENLMTQEVIDETAVITAAMKVNGDISSQGSLEVLGNVVGNIEILGKLTVSGELTGDSKAAEVYADGAKITGEVTAQGSVKVGQNSVIIGNIFATSAVIAGAVKGDIDVQGPVILDTSAIVMGDIKSKSVQINNGAVIEGMCSQCYADVNPTSFFQGLAK